MRPCRSFKSRTAWRFTSDTLERARAGVYPSSIAADVSEARLERFFEKHDNEYRIVRELRDAVTFAPHNLVTDPPFSQLDLITCRNLLIYLDAAIQPKVIALFHFALHEGGTLFLGSAETIGRETDLFQPVNAKWRIYRRIGLDLLGRRRQRTQAEGPSNQSTGERPRRSNLATITERALVNRFAPAGVLVDEHGRVLYVHGDVERYLSIPQGEATGDVISMARQGLRGRLRPLIIAALRERTEQTADAQVKRGDQYEPIIITAAPLDEPVPSDPLLLLSFADRPEPALVKPQGERGETDEHALTHFEDELRITRAELQATIEQLESSNEEYRASNEEMTSINEELQSTNGRFQPTSFFAQGPAHPRRGRHRRRGPRGEIPSGAARLRSRRQSPPGITKTIGGITKTIGGITRGEDSVMRAGVFVMRETVSVMPPMVSVMRETVSVMRETVSVMREAVFVMRAEVLICQVGKVGSSVQCGAPMSSVGRQDSAFGAPYFGNVRRVPPMSNTERQRRFRELSEISS